MSHPDCYYGDHARIVFRPSEVRGDPEPRPPLLVEAAKKMLDALEALEGWDDSLGSTSVADAVWGARDDLKDAWIRERFGVRGVASEQTGEPEMSATWWRQGTVDPGQFSLLRVEQATDVLWNLCCAHGQLNDLVRELERRRDDLAARVVAGILADLDSLPLSGPEGKQT